MSKLYHLAGLALVNFLVVPAALAIELPGIVQYERVVALSLPVSGVVHKVHVEEGQTVSEGDLLLELEAGPFNTGIEKISAELRRLKAERDFAEQEYERNKELYDRLVLSTVALDSSRLKFTRADSLWAAKKAEFKTAQYNLDKSRLHAPFTGVIIERLAEPGQFIRVDLNPPVLVRLAGTSGFIVEVEVTGDKIAALADSSQVDVRIQGNTYPAFVKSTTLITPARSLAQPSVYRVRVKLQKTESTFRPGLPATVITSG